MIIEIKGTQFQNKGAELMLYAILEKLRKEYNELTVVLDPFFVSPPYLKRAKLGIYQKITYYKFGIDWGFLGKMIPKKIRKAYGLVLNSEIDVVLDASGLAYSDKWGSGLAKRLSKEAKIWKSQNTLVILLPQAFGPFEDIKVKKYMSEAVQNIDKIYARENISYDYIRKLDENLTNLEIRQDFTNLINGTIPNNFMYNDYICVIPNKRMIDKVDNSDNYIKFMAKIIQLLIKDKYNVFILIHEGDSDLKLANEILLEASVEIPIVTSENPLEVKGIIGSSKGVVSSRFHGLVSALSQCVPSLATSWSHKYKCLLEDYDCKNSLLDINELSDEYIENKLSIFNDSEQESKRLKIYSEKNKLESESMWKEVFDIINNSKRISK